MNDLIGIDPQSPSCLRDISDILRLFSPSEGRFIADFPLEWTGEFREHLRSMSDLGAMAADEAIKNRLAHAVLATGVRFRAGLSWAQNAEFLRSEVQKLIGPVGSSNKSVVPIDKAFSDPDAFKDSNDALIDRTAESYVAAVRPILMLSRKVVLVDPYFRLTFHDLHGNRKSDRRRRVLVQFMREAVKWRQVEAFEIFYSPRKAEQDLNIQQADFQGVADEVDASCIELKVHSLDRHEADKQHARYFMGLHSALHFDHGFDAATDGSTNHVQWVGRSALTPLLSKFT